jgi:hypothetical protein
MNVKHKIFIATICLLMFVALALNAQVEKKAQVGFRFLENPVSAEVIGRGGTGVATLSNSDGIFWNPALLGNISAGVDIGLHTTRFIADINYYAVSVSVPIKDVGVIGLSFLSMDYGTFYGTRLAANSDGYEETGTFSPKSTAIGLAFSQKVSDRFSYGVHVKYALQDLGLAWVAEVGKDINDSSIVKTERGYVKDGVAFDVGACYDFNYKGVRFGAVLQNVSQEYQYENQKFPMPFAISFGVSVEPLQFFGDRDENNVVVLDVESRHPRDYQEKIKIGGEYRYMNTFILRTGYMANYDERGFTAGLGLIQTLEGVNFRLNYAFEPFGIFGAVHHISLGVMY